MVSIDEIQRVSNRIADEYRPDRIVLFGSYADGSAKPDSDVDLLVVMPFQGKSARMAATILEQIQPEIPIEILVRTPQVLAERLASNDFFLREITDKGRILYEAPNG